jgi:sortase A
MAILSGLVMVWFAAFEMRPVTPNQLTAIEDSLQLEFQADEEGMMSKEPSQLVPSASDEILNYANNYAIGDKIGKIGLPSLEISWPIYQGTDEAQLAIGVGHYLGSVMPGMQDNSILSGHRTGVFNRLGELQINDLILVQTEAGVFTYQIRAFQIVERDDETVISPTPKATLTLTTCYPFNSLTRTSDAFIVVADLIGTRSIE